MGTGLLSNLKAAGINGADALAAIVRAKRPITGYGDVGVDDSDNGLSVGRNPVTPEIRSVGLAQITDKGPDNEDDYTDHRYWCYWVLPDEGAPNESLTLLRAAMADPKIVTATNVAECSRSAPAKGCHLLSVGDLVWIKALAGSNGGDQLIFDISPSPVTVHITGTTGCGKGFYNATATKRPTADIDKSVDLTSGSIGAAGPVVIVRNLQEINRASASAWLTDAGNTNQLDFAGGRLAYVNSDGVAVIDFNGLWVAPCT